MKTKFGLKQFGSPSPVGVKIILYAVLGLAGYFFTNIDTLPTQNIDIKNWLHYLAPAVFPILAAVKDLFGTKQ